MVERLIVYCEITALESLRLKQGIGTVTRFLASNKEESNADTIFFRNR